MSLTPESTVEGFQWREVFTDLIVCWLNSPWVAIDETPQYHCGGALNLSFWCWFLQSHIATLQPCKEKKTDRKVSRRRIRDGPWHGKTRITAEEKDRREDWIKWLSFGPSLVWRRTMPMVVTALWLKSGEKEQGRNHTRGSAYISIPLSYTYSRVSRAFTVLFMDI